MRLKLDENLPRRASVRLARLGHDVHTVHVEALVGQPDDAIWAAAQREGRLLVTLDLGFGNILRFPPGSHHGTLLLRLGDVGRDAIADRLVELFTRENAARWTGCLVVATLTKVRVRPAPPDKP